MMLRCMWVPAHTGPNAPLAAVWILTPRSSLTPRQAIVAPALAEGDLRACAAQKALSRRCIHDWHGIAPSGLRREDWGTSRFPSGMTTRKATVQRQGKDTVNRMQAAAADADRLAVPAAFSKTIDVCRCPGVQLFLLSSPQGVCFLQLSLLFLLSSPQGVCFFCISPSCYQK